MKLKGFLIDLDGVLYIEDRLLPGAVDAMNYLREQGYPLRFLTNTTMRSRFALVEKLRAFGIHAELKEMFEEGRLKPRVTVYPLTGFLEAFRELAQRRARGKVVLEMT